MVLMIRIGDWEVLGEVFGIERSGGNLSRVNFAFKDGTRFSIPAALNIEHPFRTVTAEEIKAWRAAAAPIDLEGETTGTGLLDLTLDADDTALGAELLEVRRPRERQISPP